MKRIILICLLLIVGASGFGQSVVQRASPANTVDDPNGMNSRSKIIPRYQDTLQANTLYPTLDSAGKIIYTRDIKGFWYRQDNPKKWVRVVSGNNLSNNFFFDSTCNCYKIDTTTLIGIINNYYKDSSIISISILNDSTLTICYPSGCVNIGITTTITNISNVYWLGGDSISVCAIDTTDGVVTTVCDTLTIGTQPTTSVYQNWLRNTGGDIIEFGSNSPYTSPGLFLNHDTYTNTGYYKIYFDGYRVYDYNADFRKQPGFGFSNGTGIVSFLHPDGLYGHANDVRLGINYTADTTVTSPFIAGYFGSGIGYSVGTNWQGHGSYGAYLDDNNSKTTGIFFHTYDSATTDGVTIYAAPDLGGIAPVFNGQLKNYKVTGFKTDLSIQHYGYGSGSSFISSDTTNKKPLAVDANGNMYRMSSWPGSGGSSSTTILWDSVTSKPNSGNYIYNQNSSAQTSANYWIDGVGKLGGASNAIQLTVKAASGQTVTNPLIMAINNSGTELFRIHSDNQVNLFIGDHSGIVNNYAGGGVDNVGVGQETLVANTTGSLNVAVGKRALISNVTGQSNVAVGAGALLNNTSSYNIGIGHHAMQANTTGNKNVAIGQTAMNNFSGGSENVAIGYLASGNGSGNYSDVTAVGANSLIQATGNYNTAFGGNTLYSTTSGVGNTALGYATGYSNVTGNYNVFVGYFAGFNETGSNKLYIANSNTATPLIKGDFSTSELTTNGKQYISTLATGLTAPTTTGTTKMVISDANGLLSFASIPSSGITADNGLTASTSTNVQLGGTLLANTTIATGSNKLTISTSTSGVNPLYVSSNDDYAIRGVSTSAIAISGQSTNDFGISAYSGSVAAIVGTTQPSSTNTVVQGMRITRASTGTVADGVGVSYDFNVSTIGGGDNSNQLISKWTNATHATRTSQFIITGVDAGTTRNLVTMDGNGAITMPGAGNPGTTLTVNSTSGVGIQGISTGSVGILGYSQATYGVQASGNYSSTNSIVGTMYVQRRTTGTAANGIGASIDFSVDDVGGSGDISNKIVSLWTDATFATRTSQLKITGVLSGSNVDLFTANGDGSWQIRPITATAASAITPSEGMIVFVSNTNGTFTSIGLWDYENGAWHKL